MKTPKKESAFFPKGLKLIIDAFDPAKKRKKRLFDPLKNSLSCFLSGGSGNPHFKD